MASSTSELIAETARRIDSTAFREVMFQLLFGRGADDEHPITIH